MSNNNSSAPKISFNIQNAKQKSSNSNPAATGPSASGFLLNLSNANNSKKPKQVPTTKSAFGGDDDDKADKHDIQLVLGINLKTGASIAHPLSKDSALEQEAAAEASRRENLIIPAVPNKDWRNEIVHVRRGDLKNTKGSGSDKSGDIFLPENEAKSSNNVNLEELIEQEKKQLKFGFNKGVDITTTKTAELNIQEEKKSISTKAGYGDEQTVKVELTEEQRARQALLNGDDPVSELVVPLPTSISNNNINNYYQDDEEDDELVVKPLTDEEAFKQDISRRPEAPDLRAYERIPVEEFGAALLRGMGWKGPGHEGSTKGKRRTELSTDISRKNKQSSGIGMLPGIGSDDSGSAVQRPALLGLGAKPIDAPVTAEMGAWGKGAKMGMGSGNGKSRTVERVYVPLVKVNKATGKPVEEEEEQEKGKERDGKKDSERNSRMEKEYKSPLSSSDRQKRSRERSESPERSSQHRSKSSRSSSKYDEDYDDRDRDYSRGHARHRLSKRSHDYDDDDYGYDSRSKRSRDSNRGSSREKERGRYEDDYRRSSRDREREKGRDRDRDGHYERRSDKGYKSHTRDRDDGSRRSDRNDRSSSYKDSSRSRR